MVKETLKKTKTPVKRTQKRVLKPVAQKVPLTVDENLSKLAASRIPGNFVREHNGVWDHQMWLDFLEYIRTKGYDPIDPDRVGLILEHAKAKMLAKKS